jgi:hypothetical protein
MQKYKQIAKGENEGRPFPCFEIFPHRHAMNSRLSWNIVGDPEKDKKMMLDWE